MKKTELKQCQVFLTEEELKEIKILAIKEDLKLKEMLRKLILKGLK
jgi:hypothetical protein